MNNASDYVYFEDLILTTDSRRLAARYGRKHDKVLQVIQSLGCSDEFRRKHFLAVTAEVPARTGGRCSVHFVRLTKEAFWLTAAEFHSRRNAGVTMQFIDAFDALAAELHALRVDANWRTSLGWMPGGNLLDQTFDVYPRCDDRAQCLGGGRPIRSFIPKAKPSNIHRFCASIGLPRI